MLHQIAREPLEQRGVARRVLPVHLVHRHHQAVAEQALPDLVHHRAGEKAFVARLQAGLGEQRATAELGRGRGLLVFLGLFEEPLLLLLLRLVRFGRGRFFDRVAAEEHQAGLLGLARRGLEADGG